MKCAALLAIALAGCGATSDGEEVLVWHGDVTFTASERLQIESGMRFTNTFVVRRHAVIWDAPHAPESSRCTDGTILRRETATGGLYSFATKLRCIDLGVENGYPVASLAAHELVHASGVLGHAEDGELMRPNYPALSWGTADQALCEKFGACLTESKR